MEVYNIIETLGKGNFGNIYLCEKVHNKEKVVMKKIECKTQPEIIKQAKNEARILKMLKHPNIIEYFDSYYRESVFHIIMEFAVQGTLYDYIKDFQPTLQSKEWVMLIFTQLLHGLDAIHTKFIIHRDLKPENIFLSGNDSNVVKIGDFGISKLLQKNKKTHTIIGTPNYLAPELCDGKPYGRRSDIWSLGCILYEICAMERLFVGPVTKVVNEINSGTIKLINVEEYGNGVQDIINRCLQLDPKNRPMTRNLLAHAEVIPMYASLMINAGNFCLPPGC